MNQPVDNSSPNNKKCITADKYSSDYHFLSLLFGPCLPSVLHDHSVIQVVNDINNFDAASATKEAAYVILCNLTRYSDRDLTQFVGKINSYDLPLFTLTAENARALTAGGLHDTERALLLKLEIPEATPLSKKNWITPQVLLVNLHSRQLALDPTLLLPRFPVPLERPRLEKGEAWRLGRKERPLLHHIRHPLAVTKRHLKSCLGDIRRHYHEKLSPTAGAVTELGEVVSERMQKLVLGGTVFLAIFEKFDYASDWSQLVSAFCLTLKNHANATLLLWVSSVVSEQNRADLHHILCTVAPFNCSVALLEGELSFNDLEMLFTGIHFLLNVEMYTSPRLDMVFAATCGLPIISAPNSVFDLLNKELIWCALDTDARLAAPDKSMVYQYTKRHLKVNWQDLSEQIFKAYHLKQRPDVYENCRELQLERYRKLTGRHLSGFGS